MKTKMQLMFGVACLLLTSCSGISSSIHYSKGSEYLNKGEISQAIVELEKAVQLDPSMARNHTNLAAAYFADGNMEKGWYHCRQAVLCPYDDGLCQAQFRNFYNIFVKNRDLDKPGTPYGEIYANLGEPDIIAINNNQQVTSCAYGACLMRFDNEKLTECILH